MEFTTFDHFFFFLIAIILPGLSLLRGKVEMEELQIPNKKNFYYINGSVLWVGAFAVFLLWIIGCRSWEALGFSWPIISTLVLSLTALFIVSYLLEALTELKEIEDQENQEDSQENINNLLKTAPFLPENYNELLHFSFLAISAGICEEIVYRGFLVNYLYAQFLNPVWAYNVSVVFPAIIFGVVHLYQGRKAVLKITVMSLLFGTIFIFSESLLIVILLHIGVDMAGGIIGLWLNQNKNSQTG